MTYNDLSDEFKDEVKDQIENASNDASLQAEDKFDKLKSEAQKSVREMKDLFGTKDQ